MRKLAVERGLAIWGKGSPGPRFCVVRPASAREGLRADGPGRCPLGEKVSRLCQPCARNEGAVNECRGHGLHRPIWHGTGPP